MIKKTPVGSVSHENPLPGLQTAAFLLSCHMALPWCVHTNTQTRTKREREKALWCLFLYYIL